ncbi:MAG TPA: secondary thiamine-phosphate synthase enzyme YjbQ [bacterium]|nr:secondary thiamine-phosphate synthase enzyme YjbQ [bacterium]
MPLQQKTVSLASAAPTQVIDVTAEVKAFARSSKLRDGLLIVASQHTTLGVVINEKCEHLEKDIVRFLEKIAPAKGDYEHNKHAVDGRPNAHSHLLSLVIPSSVTLVVAGGELQLGTWQSVFALELDGPRPARKLTLTAVPA